MVDGKSMKLKRWSLWLFIFVVLAFASAAYASQEELDEINYSIHSHGAHWLAGENPVSKLSPQERKMRLGALKPVTSDADGVGISSMSPSTSTSSPSAGGSSASYPATLDWRNYNGYNYVTPVRDQGGCGDCWAFATTAALESNMLIVKGISAVDQAEQILLSCSGAGNCSGGYINSASNFILSTGLPSESYDPYTATVSSCSTAASGWQNATSGITTWNWVTTTSPTVDAIKTALNSYGPVVTLMDVYNDFFYYTGGIYQYTSGAYAGGHAILIVGYDDGGQYFIVKNSWGSGWGESGYFRIAYSELSSVVNFGDYTIAYASSGQPSSITVASPNGGESWQAGSSYPITWTYTGSPGAYVNIDLLNNGTVIGPIALSEPIGNSGTGSWTWKISSTLAQGNGYQIRVSTSGNAASYSDTSDGVFGITPPPAASITVTSPNGGETWKTNSSQNITWSYSGNVGSSVRIDLLQGATLDTAAVVKTISSGAKIGAGGNGSYSWKVPRNQATGSTYWIRVTGSAGASYTDTSNSNFSIVK